MRLPRERHIAQACALGENALYYYFRSREEIFEQVVRTESLRLVARIRDAMECANDPFERVRMFIVTRFALLEAFLMLHRVSSQAARELAPLAQSARQEFSQEEIALLTKILSEGRGQGVFRVERPIALATSMISACAGIERQFLEIDEAPPLVEGLEELLDVLLYGLCRSGPD